MSTEEECIEALSNFDDRTMFNAIRDAAGHLRTLHGRVAWLEHRHRTELFVNGWWISRHQGYRNKNGIELRVPGDRHPVLKQIASVIYLDDEHSDQTLYHFLDSLLSTHERMIAFVQQQSGSRDTSEVDPMCKKMSEAAAKQPLIGPWTIQEVEDE